MDNIFNKDELSADDLAVLRAFDDLDMTDWEVGSSGEATQSPLADILSSEDMLVVFVGEAEEDMSTIRRALQQLEPDEHLDAGRLQVLQHTAHKMKGTSGVIGYTAMSTLAHYIEVLTRLIINGTLVPFIALNALIQTVDGLEKTLSSIVSSGQESTVPLAEVESEYKVLNIDIHTASSSALPTEEKEHVVSEGITRPLPELPSAVPSVRIALRRFEQLVRHTEQLSELSAPLENAQAEVEKAMQELHTAQARLRRLEATLSAHLLWKLSLPQSAGQMGYDDWVSQSTSSLVARILNEAIQRTGHSYQRKSKPVQPVASDTSNAPFLWDELEIDRFTESDVLLQSLSEAIADVTTASARLQAAFAQLNRVIRKHMEQVTNVRSDTLLLRLAPINTLITRIERAISMSTLAQQGRVQFEVKGETTEIDQDILEVIKQPLLQLVRTCVASSDLVRSSDTQDRKDFDETDRTGQISRIERIWLYVQAIGNEVSIEVGFSMPVGGGSLEEVQESIRRLNGTIAAQRNTAGGISFHLRLPRSRGTVRGLLVRVGSQRVMVPFSQVQCIEDSKQDGVEPPVILNMLLNFPIDSVSTTTVQPVLILQSDTRPLRVRVDEVLGEVELVVKPLPAHLQRPGISGTAIDGMGNILLILDVPELVRRQHLLQAAIRTEVVSDRSGQRKSSYETAQPVVLVADDSVYMRQSLLRTLGRAGYKVTAVQDGMEALEHLLDHPPDVLVLDVEMPNLNGFDVLSIMRTHVELARVKVIMLTTRSSEKHRRRAYELGADTYLIKPCPQDVLLETLRVLLEDKGYS